jgi:hypothetical protein
MYHRARNITPYNSTSVKLFPLALELLGEIEELFKKTGNKM